MFLFIYSSILFYVLHKCDLHPKLKNINKKNRELKNNIQHLSFLYGRVDNNVDQIIKHENDIYRSVAGLSQIPENAYNPGFGGSQYGFEGEFLDISDTLILYSKQLETKILYLKHFTKLTDSAIIEWQKTLECTPCIQPISPRDLICIGDGFKNRFHPLLKRWRFHEGIDLIANEGEIVFCPGKGIIEKVRYSSSYGNVIVIKHTNKIKTLYGHLSEILVNLNDSVRLGDTLGKVGSTGLSSGPHLHYEVLINNKPVNPLEYIHSFFGYSTFQKIISNPHFSHD